jgi:nitroreductase
VRALRASLALNFGDAGAGALSGGVACRYVQPRTGIAIVRCARDAATHVMIAAALLGEVEGRRMRCCVRWCGGEWRHVWPGWALVMQKRERWAGKGASDVLCWRSSVLPASQAPTFTGLTRLTPFSFARCIAGTVKKVQLKAIALSRARLVALQREKRRLARCSLAEGAAATAMATATTAMGQETTATPLLLKSCADEDDGKLDKATQEEMRKIEREIREVRT